MGVAQPLVAPPSWGPCGEPAPLSAYRPARRPPCAAGQASARLRCESFGVGGVGSAVQAIALDEVGQLRGRHLEPGLDRDLFDGEHAPSVRAERAYRAGGRNACAWQRSAKLGPLTRDAPRRGPVHVSRRAALPRSRAKGRAAEQVTLHLIGRGLPGGWPAAESPASGRLPARSGGRFGPVCHHTGAPASAAAGVLLSRARAV